MKNWKWKIVKHEIKHIWLYHQQQCYQSLVLPQNKPPFRVRMISIQPLKTKFGKALERFLASMDMYHIGFNSPVPNGVSKAIFTFWAKIKTVITASCDDFCINFPTRNQDNQCLFIKSIYICHIICSYFLSLAWTRAKYEKEKSSGTWELSFIWWYAAYHMPIKT